MLCHSLKCVLVITSYFYTFTFVVVYNYLYIYIIIRRGEEKVEERGHRGEGIMR